MSDRPEVNLARVEASLKDVSALLAINTPQALKSLCDGVLMDLIQHIRFLHQENERLDLLTHKEEEDMSLPGEPSERSQRLQSIEGWLNDLTVPFRIRDDAKWLLQELSEAVEALNGEEDDE